MLSIKGLLKRLGEDTVSYDEQAHQAKKGYERFVKNIKNQGFASIEEFEKFSQNYLLYFSDGKRYWYDNMS